MKLVILSHFISWKTHYIYIYLYAMLSILSLWKPWYIFPYTMARTGIYESYTILVIFHWLQQHHSWQLHVPFWWFSTRELKPLFVAPPSTTELHNFVTIVDDIMQIEKSSTWCIGLLTVCQIRFFETSVWYITNALWVYCSPETHAQQGSWVAALKHHEILRRGLAELNFLKKY